MDSRFQSFGAKTTPDIRSGFLGIVTGPEPILPDMSGGPTDFREDWGHISYKKMWVIAKVSIICRTQFLS